MKMVGQNITTSAMASIPAEGMGWLVTVIVFVVIVGTLFLLSKNFRRFLYGAVVSVAGLLIYWLSRMIGISAGEHDYVPLSVFGFIVGFIVVSIGLGYFLQKTKWVQKLEKDMG